MKLTFYGRATKEMKLNGKLNPVKLPFHELVFVFSGELHYQIDGEDVFLRDKDIAYIPMGHIRKRIALPDPADYLSIHFLQDTPLPFPHKMEKLGHGCVPHVITAADYLYEKYQFDSLPIIENLFRSIIDYMHIELSTPRKSDIVKKMEQYMLDHLYSPFQTKELAKHFFMSPSYCHAVFKRETGIPLMRYFNNLRMQEARTLIAFGEHSLADIVDALCFYDYNYFSRSFKKHFGITPTQYKKQLYNPNDF